MRPRVNRQCRKQSVYTVGWEVKTTRWANCTQSTQRDYDQNTNRTIRYIGAVIHTICAPVYRFVRDRDNELLDWDWAGNNNRTEPNQRWAERSNQANTLTRMTTYTYLHTHTHTITHTLQHAGSYQSAAKSYRWGSPNRIVQFPHARPSLKVGKMW